MANEVVLAYLQDILDAISDIKLFFVNYPRRFDVFDINFFTTVS